MIRVFISINLIHKQETTIKPRKLLKIAALCGVCRKFWNFIPGNATFWCRLLASILTISCGHWPIGGMALPVPHPLNTPLPTK